MDKTRPGSHVTAARCPDPPGSAQVLRWRETSNMVAALDELQDASEFSEAYCASLADSSAPGCQLMEVFKSHGIFLPQLADEAGLSGEHMSSPDPHPLLTLHHRALNAAMGATAFRKISCYTTGQTCFGGVFVLSRILVIWGFGNAVCQSQLGYMVSAESARACAGVRAARALLDC